MKRYPIFRFGLGDLRIWTHEKKKHPQHPMPGRSRCLVLFIEQTLHPLELDL